MEKFKLTALLIVSLLFVYCGSDPTQAIVTIDNHPIDNQLFYTFIDSSTFAAMASTKQRQLVREFSGKWLAAKKAEKVGVDQHSLANQLENQKNGLILAEVIADYMKTRTDDVVADSILANMQKTVKVKEILFPHIFSSGFITEQLPSTALKKAERARERILSQEISFAEAATIYTVIPYMELRGGDLGFIAYKDLPKQLLDAIWVAGAGSLVGPVETKFGYHLLWIGESQPVSIPDTVVAHTRILIELGKGRHGVFENEMRKLSARLFKAKQVVLINASIAGLQNKINALNSSGMKIRFKKLEEINTDLLLGSIGEKPLSLSWFIEQSYLQGNISQAPIHTGYLLHKALSDILNRYLVVGWALENNFVNMSDFEFQIELAKINIYVEAYIKTQLEADNYLSAEIVLNRLFLEHEIKINEQFLTDD